jgi:hypothetical protein
MEFRISTHPGKHGDIFLSLVSNSFLQTWIFLTSATGGVPTILSAPIVFFLADSPGTAKSLPQNTQTLAVERLRTRNTTAKHKVHWKQFFAGLGDNQNYIHTAIHFCCNYSFAGLSNFLLTIVADMGYTSINAQGLAASPYFAAFLLCVVVAFVSGR